MDEPSNVMNRRAWIIERIERFMGRPLSGKLVVFDDTSDFTAIDWQHVVALEGRLFVVTGNERERRGIDDAPKTWVKRAIDLDTGTPHILKMVFHEEFKVRIGPLRIRCYRSPVKESHVLDLTRGDPRFMQGRTLADRAGNPVRVLDLVRGRDLLNHLRSLTVSHEEYATLLMPSLLAKVTDAFEAIHRLHRAGLCHGDIRNDHLYVGSDGGPLRWIDFDLEQDTIDFDLWSLGNVLHYVVARGFVTFHYLERHLPETAAHMGVEDASLFFRHRVMNLRKVHPYLPERLNDVLMRFAVGTTAYFDSVGQVVDALRECAAAEGWPVGRSAVPTV